MTAPGQPLVIGHNAKLQLLGVIGEMARDLEEPWRSDIALKIATRHQLNVALLAVSDELLRHTTVAGTTCADMVLLNAVHQVVAAGSWVQRRTDLATLAAQALNWRLAGDRAASIPTMRSERA